jgi:hypothetical protein
MSAELVGSAHKIVHISPREVLGDAIPIDVQSSTDPGGGKRRAASSEQRAVSSQKGALFDRNQCTTATGRVGVRLPWWRRETHMANLQETANLQGKERVNAADFAFVVFVVIITAIPVLLTLTQIYLQNPR